MEFYQYILIFHIMAFMSWMAGLFYLPRLFVYHVENSDKPDYVKVVEIQEYKLYKYIDMPAMIATVISGIVMFTLNPNLFDTGVWAYAKIAVVLLLVWYDLSMNHYRKQLLTKTCTKNGKFFRAYNEFPTLLSILIVTYVVLKDVPVIFTGLMIVLFAVIVYVLLKHAREPNLKVVEEELKKL
ncbi:MAG: CopD family protein [Sulfurimonas sp.]|uniref:CopD family protein n=1 Tax=Sulfurimonas sp. TaxID=2022749 RepID=UPI0025DD4DCC|nr:CopD family protein [Sulfurimonas sp.]MCK9491071.1 CopD family protein [Sulfurimonas sp.]